MRPILEHPTLYCDSYRFFDVTFAVQSDSREFLDLFAEMYRRFRTDGCCEAQATYHVLVGDGALVVDGETLFIDDLEDMADRAYERILDSIVARIRSHILVHAGVVSWKGQGVVFPAYSGHGKTTLVLELVRRGFKFLSDEIAAFDRGHCQIAPFPRSLRVRTGTLALCGFTDILPIGLERRSTSVASWRDKLILDIERIQPGSLDGPCPGGYVIVLSNPSDDSRELDGLHRTVYVLPERITAALVQEMQDIRGVQDVSRVPEARFPVLRLCVERGALVTPWIEEACRGQGVRLLDVIKGGERLPDFQASPRLEPMSSVEATMELIRRFRGGSKSVLLHQEHRGSAARLFLELADMVSEMDCYRLYAGKLDEMADLVSDLVNEGIVPHLGGERATLRRENTDQ